MEKQKSLNQKSCIKKAAIRKKFIEVELPLINETISVLGTPETLEGKTIKLDLTRKLKGKSLEISFKIFRKQNLIGLPKKMQLMNFYIKRILRKRTNYVEDSFETKCLDIRAIIKPFLITRKKVSRAVRKNLRNTAKDFLLNYTKEKNYMEICKNILQGDLQKELLPKLKKIYPLSFCDIRIFETKELEKVEFKEEKKPEIKEEKETKKTSKKEDSKDKKWAKHVL